MNKILFILLWLFPNLAFSATTTTFLDAGTAETGDATTFWGTPYLLVGNGTATSNTTIFYNGGHSLDINSGTTANGQIIVPTINTPVADSGTQISFYFRTDTIPQSRIAEITNAGTTTLEWALILGAGGNLSNSPSGGTGVTGTASLATNTWYRISIAYYVTNSTTFTFKVYVNGKLDSTANAGTMINPGQNTFCTRITVSGGITSANNYYDDIYIATGGASSSSQPDPGNILVTAKRPYANGTSNGFISPIGSGGSGYGSGHAPQENERPLNAADAWSKAVSGSTVTEEYNVENAAQGDISIRPEDVVDTMGWVYASSSASETASMILNGVTSNISLVAQNALFTHAAGSTSYPAGTGSDIGVTTTNATSTVTLYEAGILVAYKPTTGYRQFFY